MNRRNHQRMRPFLRAQAGFTLIEMIAAIALMSLTMLAIAGGVGSAIGSLLPSSHAIQASELAHAQLDPLCVETGLRAGTQQGISNGAHWVLTISPGASTGTVRLLMASLRVVIGIRHYRFDTVCAVSDVESSAGVDIGHGADNQLDQNTNGYTVRDTISDTDIDADGAAAIHAGRYTVLASITARQMA